MHFITAFQLGGAEEVVANLAIGLKERGHDAYVVAVRRSEPDNEVGAHQKDKMAGAGIEFSELGTRNARLNISLVPGLVLALVRRWRPDIVHSHTDIPDTMVSLAHRLMNFPVARTIHNSVLWPSHRRMGRIVEGGFCDDLVISASEDARAAYVALRKLYSLPISKHDVVIRYGIPMAGDEDCPPRAYLESTYSASRDRSLICFAGRYDKQKGFDVLIEALDGMTEQHLSRLEVHAFGQGRDYESYVSAVARKDLPVKFHPPIPRVSRLFRAFDAVVMPSRFEGLGLVALEALTVGTPVIGTTSKGLRMALPPDWPMIAPAGDATALRTVLDDFLESRFDVETLARAARQWARARFGIDRMVSEYERAYERYLQETRRTSTSLVSSS